MNVLRETYAHIIYDALDASDTLVAILDAAPEHASGLAFLEISEAFTRALGFSPPAGSPLQAIAAPDSATALRQIAACVVAGRPWHNELACLDAHQQRIWIDCHLVPNPGRAIYLLIGREITARRAELHDVKAMNTLLLKAFRAANTPLAIVTQDGRFVMTNACMDSQLRVPLGSLAGKSALACLTPQSRLILESAQAEQAADGKPIHIDVDLLRADGESLPVTLSSSPVLGLDRQHFGVVTTHPREPRRTEPAAHVMAGRLRFISLEAVRDALKDQWADLAKRVMETAEHFIHKRLATADQLSRDGDCGFMICFASATEEEASFRAAAIARDLRKKLIGLGEDEDLTALQVVVARVPVSGREAAEPQIKRHLDGVQAEGLRAAQADLRPPRLTTVYHTASATPFAVFVAPAPRLSTPGSLMIPASSLSDDLAPLKWLHAHDMLKSIRGIFLNINFGIFLSKSRTEYFLEQCTKLPQPLRAHLHLVLSQPPAGTTTSLMQEILRRLTPFCAGLCCHFDDWAAPSFDFKTCPFTWITADLPNWDGLTPAPLDRAKRLTTLLGAHKIRALALGAPSTASFHALHEAGVSAATLHE